MNLVPRSLSFVLMLACIVWLGACAGSDAETDDDAGPGTDTTGDTASETGACNLGIWEGNASGSDLEALAGYTEISGNLIIFYIESVTDLETLSCLRRVGGNLEISGCEYLTTVSGFENLESVDGNVIIGRPFDDPCNGISNLDGFLSLKEIGGDLEITWNPQLANIDGLASLESIGGSLIIEHNKFDNLNGFGNLVSIGDSIHISTQSQLVDIDGLSLLNHVAGDLIILQTGVTDLWGLDNIETIDGDFKLGICGFFSYEKGIYDGPEYDCQEFIGNQNLQSLDGLGTLKSVGGDFLIMAAGEIVNLEGLDSLDTIGGDLVVDYNRGLKNLDGLDQLKEIGGRLNIGKVSVFSIGNPLLENLAGLQSLNSLGGGEIWIDGNPCLPQMEIDSFLTHLDEIGWTGSINVNDNLDGDSCNP